MKKQKKPGQSKANRIFLCVTLLVPVVALAGFFFLRFQMERMENGILDVCATQQDAYVNLVLDQINLNSGRGDEEIILDILGTLDASTNKYWTFSAGQTMLFVKDVLETNKYKGLTAATYYDSESAADFFDRLPLNRVVHADIEIAGRDYIASGTAFVYREDTYKLCLLTNRAVLLDNNSFLGAKTELWTMVLCVLGMLVVIPILLSMELLNMQTKLREEERAIQEMNENLVKMNERFAHKDLHDTRNNLWKEDVLDQFAEGLQEKGASETVFMRIHCPTPEDRQKFLDLSHYTLDRKVLRFEAGKTDLILLFVGIDYDTAFLNVLPLLSREIVIQRTKIAGGEGGLSPKDAVRAMRYETAAVQTM